jgi:hypothetical protein
MPMRGELAVPAMRSNVSAPVEEGAWAVVGFCFVGFATTICVALCSQPFDQIPLLVIQSNLW